ncbi:MAG: HTH domain-containing protein [Deltaproteobacteria bacterium]|nr:HTH domain-containing protein [Deltaproteobacteria bacterium]
MGQRKTNDQEILRLLKEGRNQKEIAQHFGVSPVAIHKRLKRLTPPPEMSNFNSLTQKEKKFCIAVAEGKTQTQAVLQSYDVTSRESAKVMGSQLMAKPEIQMSVTELMDYCGVNKMYRIKRLKDIIDSPDLGIAHKGLDMSFRLDGSFAAEKHLHAVLPIEEMLTRAHRGLFSNDDDNEKELTVSDSAVG